MNNQCRALTRDLTPAEIGFVSGGEIVDITEIEVTGKRQRRPGSTISGGRIDGGGGGGGPISGGGGGGGGRGGNRGGGRASRAVRNSELVTQGFELIRDATDWNAVGNAILDGFDNIGKGAKAPSQIHSRSPR